ncbi:hypothetical protein PIB30_064203 [Stylosanthes scabra]|uniref:Replication protein A 70 kDa DNA-binding subunit B/D first OB fold domain-containing protein n=1 Tax=Stylosanthes scabra TaxID=79078 RepID=A0ABU6VNE2_9FABA|nr:hypothetical protein [Stylosanthes scabra]
MALHIDFIENIGTKKGHWRLQVYVIRAWKEMHKTNPNEVNSMELILQDIKSSRIQASIGKPFFSRHGGSIEEFGMTTVQRVHQLAFPLEPFRFCDISELITADPLDCSQLIDVIAEVVGKEEPRDNHCYRAAYQMNGSEDSRFGEEYN